MRTDVETGPISALQDVPAPSALVPDGPSPDPNDLRTRATQWWSVTLEWPAPLQFWWTTMRGYIKQFKSPPACLLQHLPVLRRSGSHISVDFLIGLPPLAANTVVFIYINTVKYCWLLPPWLDLLDCEFNWRFEDQMTQLVNCTFAPSYMAANGRGYAN